MATYKADIIQALKNLGGSAHLKQIHKEVARLRKGKLKKTWKYSIQENLQRHSSDSIYGRGKYGSGDDIFYMVEGKRKGIWGLREMSENIKNYKSSVSLSDIIKKISKDWINYRKASEGVNKVGSKIKRVNQNHPMYDLVINQWSDKISENVNLKKYKVESKLGDGQLSAGPWLAIMDRSLTETATEEFYVVYLFSRSAQKLYLSIGIGATQFQEIYGMTNF